jgi:hypothetical protein
MKRASYGYSDGGNIAQHLAKKAPELLPRASSPSPPNTLVSATTDDSLRTFNNHLQGDGIFSTPGLPKQKYMRTWDLMLKDIGLSDDDLQAIHTKSEDPLRRKDMIKE